MMPMTVEIPRQQMAVSRPSTFFTAGADQCRMDPPPHNWTDSNLAAAIFPTQGVKTPTRPLDAAEIALVGDGENFVNNLLDGQKLDDERRMDLEQFKAPAGSLPLLIRECSTRVLSDDDLPQMIREDSKGMAVGMPGVDREPDSLIDPYNRHLSNNLGFDKALPPAVTEELEKPAIQHTDENQMPEGETAEALAEPELAQERPRRQSVGPLSVAQPKSNASPPKERKGAAKRRHSEEVKEEVLTQCAANKKHRKPVTPPKGTPSANDRQDMQKWARKGQEHWGKQVRQMRQDWQVKKMGEKDPHFADQIAMCTRAHIKSQHECLLRELQAAKVDNLIHSCKFSDTEADSFLGWRSFRITHSRHAEFRKRIESLFATVPLENTLNNVFRRAGLIPDHCPDEGRTRSWEEAWRGLSSFVYVCEKRATYS